MSTLRELQNAHPGDKFRLKTWQAGCYLRYDGAHWFDNNGAFYSFADINALSQCGDMELYKEPVKHVVYVNVYGIRQGTDVYCTWHRTRGEADEHDRGNRVACKRLEIVEGEYDE